MTRLDPLTVAAAGMSVWQSWGCLLVAVLPSTWLTGWPTPATVPAPGGPRSGSLLCTGLCDSVPLLLPPGLLVTGAATHQQCIKRQARSQPTYLCRCSLQPAGVFPQAYESEHLLLQGDPAGAVVLGHRQGPDRRPALAGAGLCHQQLRPPSWRICPSQGLQWSPPPL